MVGYSGGVSGGVNHPMPAARIVSVDFGAGAAALFVDKDFAPDGEGVVQLCGWVWGWVGGGREGWWCQWRRALHSLQGM